MALNYAPNGLQWLRPKFANMPNFATTNRYFIKKGYGTAIAFGDLVYTQNSGSGNQGYIAPYTTEGSVGGGTVGGILGVFLGCAPYYDLTYQTEINKNFWAGTENPSGDVDAFICDDPLQVFLAQCNGGPITTAHRGLNIDFGGGGLPNALGQSVGYLDFATVATTSTLPLRIVGWSNRAAYGYDPTSATSANQPTYNYAEVSLNPGACESLQGTGI
jgi:hypothetical protein